MQIANLLFWWLARPGRTRRLTVGGIKRTYHVHVPQHLDPARPVPVVLALHGATMNGPMMAWLTGLNRKADQAGFVVAYPDGTGRLASYTWNGGTVAASTADDVGFVRAVLDDLPAVVRVDPRRVFATGLSNGAVMAYRLAAELADRIAAVAPVAGTLGAIDCQPSRPVPVLHVHGTEDEYVPFAGGRGRKSLAAIDYRPVGETVRLWVRANGCRDEPTVEVLPDTAGDGTRVVRSAYAGGPAGAEVVLVAVEGGGHTWPDRQVAAGALGRSTRNVSANDLIWAFFERHPMP